MALSAYQCSVRSVVFGAGSASGWEIDYERADVWTPFGARSTKTADVDLELANGAYGSPDYQGPLVFTWPLFMDDTPANLATAVKTLLDTTWAPASADITYTGNMGSSDFSIAGRPRTPVDVNLKEIAFGRVFALVTFVGLAGTITY